MVRHYDAPRRRELLLAALEFVRAASRIPGVLSISLVGSICTERVNPKDVDFLVRIADEAATTVTTKPRIRSLPKFFIASLLLTIT